MTTTPVPDVDVSVRRRRKRAKLTLEQQALAERYVALARSLTKPFNAHWPRATEEFASAALFALVESAESFDPSRGVKFATFARFRITGALRDVLRRLQNERHSKDLPNVCREYRHVPNHADRRALMLVSFEPTVADLCASKDEVEHWLGSLPERHAVACRELYLQDQSMRAVGVRLGCSKSRVSHLHAEALAILREQPSVQAAAVERGLDASWN